MKDLKVVRKTLSFVFDADDLTKTAALSYEGQLNHLHLRVPNFTNAVTATVTLSDKDGYVLYTSAAKARNANYNLETETEWACDQLVPGSTLTVTVTLSGVAGGTGGTVTAVARLLGEEW